MILLGNRLLRLLNRLGLCELADLPAWRLGEPLCNRLALEDASSREIDIFGLTLNMTHEFGKHLLGTPSARASARSWRA